MKFKLNIIAKLSYGTIVTGLALSLQIPAITSANDLPRDEPLEQRWKTYQARRSAAMKYNRQHAGTAAASGVYPELMLVPREPDLEAEWARYQAARNSAGAAPQPGSPARRAEDMWDSLMKSPSPAAKSNPGAVPIPGYERHAANYTNEVAPRHAMQIYSLLDPDERKRVDTQAGRMFIVEPPQVIGGLSLAVVMQRHPGNGSQPDTWMPSTYAYSVLMQQVPKAGSTVKLGGVDAYFPKLPRPVPASQVTSEHAPPPATPTLPSPEEMMANLQKALHQHLVRSVNATKEQESKILEIIRRYFNLDRIKTMKRNGKDRSESVKEVQKALERTWKRYSLDNNALF